MAAMHKQGLAPDQKNHQSQGTSKKANTPNIHHDLRLGLVYVILLLFHLVQIPGAGILLALRKIHPKFKGHGVHI